MKQFLVLFLLSMLWILPLSAQQPWLGGLNACQFGRMDLDGDGQRDLLAFDRHGDRLLCFLNKGGEGEIDYRYTADYDHCFPKLNDWAVFADYDGDGLEDIFTYSKGWAGIKVYRNVTSAEGLDFELVVSPFLASLQGGGEVNILASEADYPAILDIDGDGDLDLLTFGVLGTFIEKHVNRSMERYGHCDSLVFERTDLCWGYVGESEEDNLMYLDTCLFGYGIIVPDGTSRHRGATVTVRDVTGDGLLDLILADVDYPGLTLLTNGGDAQNAVMVSQESAFPPQHPVRLFSMPVPFFTDVDNDGVEDLLVSPFDPDPMASMGMNSIWLYLNQGRGDLPDYQLYTTSFLQEEMLDLGTGAYPVATDLDGDGLLDLVLGTLGEIDSTWYHYGNLETHRKAQLTWLRNVGTATAPAFSVEAFPFPLSDLDHPYMPAFGDLDGDGKNELLLGTAEGALRLYDDDGTLLDTDFLHYNQSWSAPCLFDVDHDGLLDLIVGNATGRLSFYHGTGNMTFEKMSDFWGDVDVRDYTLSYTGHSVPTVFRSSNMAFLCVGSESGRLLLYDGLSVEDATHFDEVSSQWALFCEGMPSDFGLRSAAALADFDGDGRQEVFVGNYSGGLQLFNAQIPVNIGVQESQNNPTLDLYPNPVSSQIHIIAKEDGPQRVTVMDLQGRKCLERSVEGNDIVLDVSALPSGIYLLRLGGVSRIFLKR